MGVQPPFLYDAIKTEGPRSPYREFDPKAVSRASWQEKPQRPKTEGPLVSFNQHPDSYLILPTGNLNAKEMSPSTKKWIKWMRIIQLILRIGELLAAAGLLVMMILIRGVDEATGWIMRIAPGVAIIHTVYGVYHLARKPSGRTPASTASYMLFASFFDVSIIPFYAFSALVAMTRQSGWRTILPNSELIITFSKVVFYLGAVGGGLHLFSLAISLYLAVTFRKITKLPPDMNPLEDNLTSRHKRNKSSISMATTLAEKRISTPLESKRSSGAAYEDLNRPPSIPFFHTRTQSTSSFSTYKSTPPPSRDARMDLPSRQYGVTPSSARSSMVDLKRNSGYMPPSPPKRERGSYAEVPHADSDMGSPRQKGNQTDGWYASDSLSKTRTRSNSPKKGAYQPIHQRYDSSDDLGSMAFDHPNPLEANPPTPRHSYRPPPNLNSNSPLSEISNNRTSSDIAESNRGQIREMTPHKENFKAKYYGELKPGTPPIMVGAKGRQVSGNDYGSTNSFKVLDRREVSGKIAEEGRGGERGWGTRLRKISGI